MNQEVTRRHYLDAMGITTWGARYQLPNARPTEACEWEDATPDAIPPRERLHALLDDAPSPKRQPSKPQAAEPQASSEVIASPSAVRALLGQDKQSPQKQASDKPVTANPATAESSTDAAPAAPAKPLEFALSCLCLNGRWLMLQAGEMSALERQLLANLLQAAGVHRGELPQVTRFSWPPMSNAFAVEDPLAEAREGVAAFIEGQASRQGWQLARLLWWGELGSEQAPLDNILNIKESQSHTLSLPVWQGPALADLLEGDRSKRDVWPALRALGQQWSEDSSVAAEPNADDH